MSLVYLVFDFYPQVSSLQAILTTPAFWILALVFGFLNSIAFSLLYASSLDHVRALVHAPHLAVATVQLLSTIGVYSVLQSFTLQFAGQKVIDVEQLVARFRAAALKDAALRRALLKRKAARWVAGELRPIYKADPEALTEDYLQIMNLAGLKMDRIRNQLHAYSISEGLERESILTELVMRMALTDRESARSALAERRA